jgi:Uma2 family endonuclease
VLDKVGEYLEAGVRLVWVIDPRKAKAVVYRSLSDVTELQASGELDGGDVLPHERLAGSAAGCDSPALYPCDRSCLTRGRRE